MLVSAITLHNIPEELVVGVAFGAVAAGLPNVPEASSLAAAVALAVGIGLQNFPEGTAVAMPLRREGMAHVQRAYSTGSSRPSSSRSRG